MPAEGGHYYFDSRLTCGYYSNRYYLNAELFKEIRYMEFNALLYIHVYTLATSNSYSLESSRKFILRLVIKSHFCPYWQMRNG